MASSNGMFVWYELMTTDLAGARDFYTKVVDGWTAEDSKMPGMDYWMWSANGKPLGGMMILPEEAKQMGAPPHWLGYIGVADVNATVEAIKAAGGQVFVGPKEIPNMGSFAICADPHGAVFAIWQSTSGGDENYEYGGMAPGNIGWNELHAGDLDSDFAFYSKLFGWEKKDAMDMGEMGTYQIYGIGDIPLGGMMTKPAAVPMAHWGYYINVPSVDAGIEKVKAAGGNVIMGPQEVPGGSFIMIGTDPQGAHFALVGPK